MSSVFRGHIFSLHKRNLLHLQRSVLESCNKQVYFKYIFFKRKLTRPVEEILQNLEKQKRQTI